MGDLAAPTSAAGCQGVHFRGHPAWQVQLGDSCGGDCLVVARQGGQVLSWTSGGRERLFLSSAAVCDGRTAIRGGIPVCFPQFNQRGSLPKHGFARNLPWTLDAQRTRWASDHAQVHLSLHDSEATRTLWPHAFRVSIILDLKPGQLQVTLDVHNSGDVPWAFTGALHTYLGVSDICQASLSGLAGMSQWDAVTDCHGQAPDQSLRFGEELDRVYTSRPQAGNAPVDALVLHDGEAAMAIAQSECWGETVVWNPGPVLGARLSDMSPSGHMHMLCVEAAQVMHPIQLPEGGQWRAWQRLTVLPHPRAFPSPEPA